MGGYIQILMTLTHSLPCQFMKKYVKNEKEARRADEFEAQKGIIVCLVSGLLPPLYWICHWLIHCSDGVTLQFGLYAYLIMYVLLAVRFGLAHLWKQNEHKIVFREYDNWWSPLSFLWPIATFLGVPLLGWSGGFYLGTPGVNYKHEGPKKAMAMAYLPINLFTWVLFTLHCLARIFNPSLLLKLGGFPDMLGYSAFFCSLTDVAMPIMAFPSGAVAIRRWNFGLFAMLWLSWCALLVCSIALPRPEAYDFFSLDHVACK